MDDSPERAMLAGASAAKLLAGACENPPENVPPLKLEAVRSLALDLERHLEGLSEESPDPGILAEAAQKCADLATLAACNAEGIEASAETVRLAAEATASLSRAAEETPGDLVGRDARSAAWKASLAARQMGV